MSIARHHFNNNWDYTYFVVVRTFRWCISSMIPRFIKRRRRRLRIPPFAFITQIGDPVLRFKALPVPQNEIDCLDTARLIVCMIQCQNKYGSKGVSAPQVGIPLRVIVMEFKEQALSNFSAEEINERQMSVMPLTVLINPTIEITSDNIIRFPEGCLSLCGYGATVPRFEKCILRGINNVGVATEVELHGWNARIAQHQMDHLDGKFFIDRMDMNTFHCHIWREINDNEGEGQIIVNKSK